jgi:hypothetical protein
MFMFPVIQQMLQKLIFLFLLNSLLTQIKQYFPRILIAKVVSGSNSINSIDTYKINDVSKLIDRVVKLESLLAKHNLT